MKDKNGDRKAVQKSKLEFKVSPKGGVSVYGMGRFPTTLYYGQWVQLLDVADELRSYLEAAKRAGKLSLGKD